MAEIDMRADTYALRLKDGDVTWCVDAFALVGALQVADVKADQPVPFDIVVRVVRENTVSEPAGVAMPDVKAFAIGQRVFKYMESVGNG